MNSVIERIREAAYHIPGKYLQDCSTGMAQVYAEGLRAGRLQALEILANNE